MDSDRLGNTIAKEGCDRCTCGCKYWEKDICIDCGTDIFTLRMGDRYTTHPNQLMIAVAFDNGNLN